MRVTNYSYAATRLSGLIASLSACGLVIWLVTITDQDWTTRGVALAVVVALALGAFNAARKAAFWIEADDAGVEVRTLWRHRRYLWKDISDVRVEIEHTWITAGVPFLWHRFLRFRASSGPEVAVRLSLSDKRRLERIEAFRQRAFGLEA